MKFRKSISSTLAALLLSSSVVVVNAEETNSFKDVKKTDWYYESVNKLATQNVINGYGDGTFKPHTAVTRAQAATIIASALQLDLTNVKSPGFKDVSEDNSHYKAIAALTELGVFKKSEQFNPDGTLTRKQLSKVLVEAFDLQTDRVKAFKDVLKNNWEYEYVSILGALGISTNASEFKPTDEVTRAHLVAFVKRTIDHKRNDGAEDLWDTWEDWEDDRKDALDDLFDDLNDDNGGNRPDGQSDDTHFDDNGGDRPDGQSDDTHFDDNGGDRPDGQSDDTHFDDNGGDRPDGQSDDTHFDDNGGDRPDGVSDDTHFDDNGGDRPRSDR